MASDKKLNEIILDIYRELYANCTVPCDFDKLVEEAEIGDDGRKIIPYDEYEIDDDLMQSIVEKKMSAHRLKKWEKDKVRFNVYLGVSPKSINVSTKDKVVRG